MPQNWGIFSRNPVPRPKNRKQNRKVERDVRAIVARLAARAAGVTVSELQTALGMTRPGVHRYLRPMLAAGQLSVEGRGPATRYRAGAPTLAALHERAWPLAGLDEDRTWTEAWAALSAKRPGLPEPARSLLRYGFTEMVNNAIDHSGAREVVTRLGMTPSGRVYFDVIDRGVGALENIRRTLGLSDHLEAMQQLSKGKLSTQPERHSGEGLFFTSKAADHFELIANGLRGWSTRRAPTRRSGRQPRRLEHTSTSRSSPTRVSDWKTCSPATPTTSSSIPREP